MRSANFFAKTLSRPPRLTKVNVALLSSQLACNNDYVQRAFFDFPRPAAQLGTLLDFEQSYLDAVNLYYDANGTDKPFYSKQFTRRRAAVA